MIKHLIKSGLRVMGLEVRPTGALAPPASTRRAIGNMRALLEDVKSREFRPKGIIDVGAHRGGWTRLARSVFPDAPVIMIEPLKEMQDSLAKLAAAWPDCYHVNAGVGREEGELFQSIWQVKLSASTFMPEPEAELIREGRQRLTKLVTIDSLLSTRFSSFSPDLVKFDIQGYELEALMGAQMLFGRTELFIVEVSLFSFLPKQPIARDVIEYMSNRGYELYDIPGYLRRPRDGALGQLDLAFVKSNGMFRTSHRWS